MTDSLFAIIQFLADVNEDKVYISQSTERDGLFALWVLSPQTIARVPDGVARLIEIGRTLQTLAHPNIKPVVSQTWQNNQPALVMPYFEGQSAADFLRGGRPMPPERVIRVGLELADALNAAHNIGIYHGGIRPESVILAANGAVILGEWGSNLLLPPDWRTSLHVAPELREGAAASHHSDIWSLGALMYHLLTLELPGTGEDLARLCPDCPPALIDLIDRMLDPDPYARPYCAVLVGKLLERERPPQERTRFTPHKHLPATLPMRATRFFGREAEIARLHELLHTPANRIVSVCGPAGSGRTTLVLEAANRFFNKAPASESDAGWKPEQVYFVRFSPDSRSDHLILTLTIANNTAFEYQLDELQQVINFLSDRATLLILDDIEYFFGGTLWLNAIIEAVPNTKILLTAIAPLDIPGEATVTLSGLTLPTDSEDSHAPSVQLFETIARRHVPNFSLTPTILAEVVKLCRRVGGAPLSIVLAAGAITGLDIATLTEFVSNALSVNATSDLNFARIRAVFDFVWLLLSPQEREIITRLSIIRGEISREAAKALGDATPAQLAALVGKSLLQRVPETGGFTLHPLVQQCAQDWFTSSPYSQQMWHDHSAYYLKLLNREGKKTLGAGQIEAAEIITANLYNIRPAWLWAVENQHFEAIDETGEALYQFLLFSLRLDEGRLWFAPAVSALNATPATPRRDAIMAALLFYHSILARQDVNGAEALRCIEQAESLNRAAWSLRVNVLALYARGLYELGFGNILRAQAIFEQMLTLALYEYNPRSELAASLYLGAAQYQRIAPDRIALERGKGLLRRALELSQQLGDNFALGAIYLHLGMIHASSKDPLTAIDFLQKGLRAAMIVNNTRTATNLLIYVIELATQQGKHAEAQEAAQQLLALSRTYNHPWSIASALTSLAQLELLAGHYPEARDLCQTMLHRIQSDPRGQPARTKARCIYAYALACLGEYEEALEQVRVAMDDLEAHNTSEAAEVWIWLAVLTHWGRTISEATEIFETIIYRYGSTLSPHHRAIVYSARAHLAVEMKDMDTAQASVLEMSNALHEVVSYDYRGSPLLNLLDPRLTCSLFMIFWAITNDQTDTAHARLYEAIPLAIQTNSPYSMMRALSIGASLLIKKEPQQASTWLLMIINNPHCPHSLRSRVSKGFEQLKPSIPPRALLGATAHAKTLTLPEALRDLRALL